MKKMFFVFLLFSLCQNSFGQRDLRENYIKEYDSLAKKQMRENGIPASIIMAQAVLESRAGQSYLAKSQKNHFGMKIRGTQNYERYESILESYLAHSQRLKSGKTYKPLFDLFILDYKAWARGLKKAGYATDPEYSEKLIRVVEDYKLASLDTAVLIETISERMPKMILL